MSITAFVFGGFFVAGFFIVGRWVDNVVAQLLLGALMGVAIMIAVACVLTGVAFAGCLLVSGTHMNFK